MRITLFPLIAIAVATVLHIPIAMLFVYNFDLGIKGLAVAQSIRDFNALAAITCYGFYSRQVQQASVSPFTRETLNSWAEYLRVGFPSAVIICAEWWAIEICLGISGLLGVADQASFTLINTIIAFIYTIPRSI